MSTNKPFICLSQPCVYLLSLVFNAGNSLVMVAESRRKLSSAAPLHQSVTSITGPKSQTKVLCLATRCSKNHCQPFCAPPTVCLVHEGQA